MILSDIKRSGIGSIGLCNIGAISTGLVDLLWSPLSAVTLQSHTAPTLMFIFKISKLEMW